ncbi:MAG: LysR substrate-binding domain-containing protein, partial [Bradyrhizobium sp.]
VEAVNALTQDLVGGRLGTLSVAAAFPIANGYLAKAVATFIAERPNVRVALQSLTSPQVLDRVVHREVELGIAYEPVVSSEVETRVLMRAGIACVMAADHPLARRKEVAVRDLEPYSIITYLPQALFRLYVDRALSAAGIVPNIIAQVSLSLTGIMLARHGAGVALVEPLLVASMGLPGTVTRPLKPRIDVKTLLIRHKTAPQSRIMTEFVTHLTRTIAAEHGQ